MRTREERRQDRVNTRYYLGIWARQVRLLFIENRWMLWLGALCLIMAGLMVIKTT